jgi:hypothetical protein
VDRQLLRLGHGHAELALAQPGRQVRVGVRVDVRVDAQSHAGDLIPERAGAAATRSSSSADSTLIDRTPAEIAASISASSLPTPLNTIFAAGIPAASARFSSPPDTMSAPAPRLASVRSTAWLLLALIA